MRVGMDVTSLHRHRSGIGTYTDNLLQALGGLPSPPDLVLLAHRPLEGVDLSVRYPTARSADTPIRGGPRGSGYPARALWMQTWLPWELARLDLDLCHFPNYLAPILTRCPLVVTFHDMALFRLRRFFTWKKRCLTRSLLPVVAHKARVIITVSEHSRREITEILQLDPAKVRVVHEAPAGIFQPIDDAAFTRAVRERHRLPERYVLSVGTLEPRKNLPRLLDAFDALLDARPDLGDVELLLAGDRGWSNAAILERCERMGCRGRVRWLGYVPLEDLPALYAMAQGVAYPSLYEGFGLPILEAMACGTPVLTSRTSSMGEIAGRAAWLVDPESTPQIRDGLEQILGSPELRAELREKGLARARCFSWARAASETLEIYRETARGRARPAASPVRRAAISPATSPAELRRGVLRALIYADLFDSPLTLPELHADLLGLRIDREALARSLAEDAALRVRVDRAHGTFFLQGRAELIRVRESRAEAADRLLDRTGPLLRRMSALPFVRMLAFSGGTSHRNSPDRQDIDLFVVTARDRVWTVYFMMVLLARLHRQRPAICANYLVDVDHLRLPQTEDFFAGHEILHLEPLSGADQARALRAANPWVETIFPNAPEEPVVERGAPPRTRTPQGQRRWEALGTPFWPVAEAVLRRALETRLRRKALPEARSGVILGPGVLKLHVRDHRPQIVRRYRERLREEGLWDATLDHLLADAAPPAVAAMPEHARPTASGAPAAAWDEAALTYDAEERENPVLSRLRDSFRQRVETRLRPGQRVLDLGCGTGRDALWMIERGAYVTAVDLSPRMLDILERGSSALEEAAAARLETRLLSLDRLDRLFADREGLFDGAIADFGSLNAVEDPDRFAHELARLLRPGGWFVAAIMNRVCAWEVLIHLLRLQPRRAFRRWGRGVRRVPLGRARLAIRYYSPGGAWRVFAPDFQLDACRPHGCLVPPPYLGPWFRRHPRLLDRLVGADLRLAHAPLAAGLGDHFLIELRRRGTTRPAHVSLTSDATVSPAEARR